MSYRIAGIDVHKKMLAVVVSDVDVESEYAFERRKFGSNPEQLRSLAAWLLEQEAEEVVMESTAQYWKPVWEALERYWKPLCEKREDARRKSGTLHLAQALSNHGRQGRKRDFPDAERLVKRLLAQELTLSFVPDAEQRLWRTVTRKKTQLRRDRIRLQNQLEALLEEAHIKLSSLVSDLFGRSAQRMLAAIAGGETDPAKLAALADQRLRATTEQLCDALGACKELNPVYRRLLNMTLEELELIDGQISRLDHELAGLLKSYQDTVERWRRCRAWEWTQHSRSSLKSGPSPPLFPPPNVFPLGLVFARVATRRQASITATALPRAIATCDAYSIKSQTREPERKAVSSKLCIVGWSRASDITKPSESSPIDSAA
jgi:transposase